MWLVQPVRPSPSLTVIGICNMLCASAGAAESEKHVKCVAGDTKLKRWRPAGWCSLSLFGWLRTLNVLSNAGWLLQPVPMKKRIPAVHTPYSMLCGCCSRWVHPSTKQQSHANVSLKSWKRLMCIRMLGGCSSRLCKRTSNTSYTITVGCCSRSHAACVLPFSCFEGGLIYHLYMALHARVIGCCSRERTNMSNVC